MARNSLSYFVFWSGVLLIAGAAILMSLLAWQNSRKPDLSPERIIAASQGAFRPGRPPSEDIALLETAAAEGIALAQNNLAVILLRSRDSNDRARADALLEAAAEQGLLQARYNIAYLIPHRFDTDPALVERQITLLQQNVAEGDPHSMALLAARLYYANRDRFVSDREALRLILLEQAAASDDPEYLFQYGAELWNRIRNMAPSRHDAGRTLLIEKAADAFLRAHASGEPRAAQRIAAMLEEQNIAPLTDRLAALDLPTNAFGWMELAAEGGLVYGACHYAHDVLGIVWPDALRDAPFEQISATIVQNAITYPPEIRQKALAHAATCATPADPPGFRVRAFGDGALYRAKYRGTWPALLDSRGQADVLLGVNAALGIFGPVDREAANFHMQRAAQEHDYDHGLAFLDRLP